MTNQDIKTTTKGYRDITECLENGSIKIEKFDVIRGIIPEEKQHQVVTCDDGQEFIYTFYDSQKSLSGRIFPCDEIIIPEVSCDVIVQKFRWATKGKLNVDVNPYHDFEVGEIFGVSVPYLTERGDPSFKLYNRITGFVKDRKSLKGQQIIQGTKLLVEVIAFKRANNREIVLVRPIESLDDL